jgi:A/G-specific adenine glycosylase
VLGRVGSITEESALRAWATKLAAGARPGDLNQALMELGATVCAPRAPSCAACPLKHECLFPTVGRLAHRTAHPRAKNFTDVTWPLAIVRRGGKILLRRRADTLLLARLWELPGVETSQPEYAMRALRRELRALPVKVTAPRRIGAIHHSITYRRIHAPVYCFDCVEPFEVVLPRADWRWTTPSDLARYPVSSMTKKALAVLAAHETRSA